MTGDDVVAHLRAAGCVWAEDEAAILLAADGDLAAMVERRCAGEPLESVVGWAELCGVRVACAPGVFVPRRRSELLVRTAGSLLADGAVVVDMCCGTGAVGAALQTMHDLELHAADLDPDAVACARRNVDRVHEGDLFAALPVDLRGRVDVVVANTPYVPTAEIALLPSEAREHEHRVALDGGPDGLDVQRRVAAEVGRWLRRGGHVLAEASQRQAGAAAQIMRDHGLTARTVSDDDLGATVVVGTT